MSSTAPSSCRALRRRALWLLLVVLGLITLSASPALADDETTRYFEQLRGLRLFALAEGYCLDRLASERLSPQQRAQLTLELSRTLSEHAKFSSGREQQELWDRAASVIDEFVQAHPQTPLRWQLEIQLALIPAARGDFLRWQSELTPADLALRRRAEAAFERSAAKLKQKQQELSEQFRLGLRRPEASAIPQYELRALLLTAKFEQARNWLGIAHLAPKSSAERTEAVARGQALFKELSDDTIPDDMRLLVRVHLAECSRLNGDYTRANHLLREIESDSPPPAIRDRTMAERTRMLLELDRPDDAAQQLLAYRRQRGQLPGELRFLSIRALGALAELAEQKGDAGLAGQIRTEIQAQVTSAVSELGGYWGARCRALLEFSQRADEYGVELAEIVQAAESLYAQSRNDEAVREYARAVSTAQRLGKPELAVEFAYTRASILLHEQDYEEAGEGFREIAERAPANNRGASAHLLFAYCLGKLYEQNRTAPRREAYTAALEAHRQQFPGEQTYFDATRMLAQLQERRLQTNRALELYSEIPLDHRHGPDAQAAVARCYQTIIERLRAQPSAGSEAWQQQALRRLDQMVTSFPTAPGEISLLQAQTVLRVARLYLDRADPGYAAADHLLERIFLNDAARESETADESGDAEGWAKLIEQATQLRIVSLASQGRFSQAEILIERLSHTGAADLLNILNGLLQLSPRTDDSTRRALGELQLRAAEELRGRRDELDADQQQLLDRCLAEAYTATGMTDRAAETYESLLQRNPRDKQLRTALARVLNECGKPECLEKAKQHWRELESLETPGQGDWFRARYQVARCTFKLGQFEECRKLLTATRLLYPTLGGPELKVRFETLYDQLNQQTRR